MARLAKQRLKGATILEVIVAMVLLVIIMGIAASVYMSVLSSSRLNVLQSIDQRLDELQQQSNREQQFFDTEWADSTFIFRRRVSPHPTKEDVILVEYEVIDGNKQSIAQRKEWVLLTRDE